MSRLPALKLLFWVSTGIAIGYLLELGGISIFLLALFSLVLSLVVYYKYNFNIALILLALNIGLILEYQIDEVVINKPDKLLPDMKSAFDGEVLEIKKKDTSFTLCIVYGSIDTPELPRLHKQKYLLKIYGKTTNLNAGDFIKGHGSIRLPHAKVLPIDFPEDTYFAGQNIKWLASASSINVAIYHDSKSFNYFREYALESIKHRIDYLFGYRQNAIVSAIILADKSRLSPEIREAYSLSGTAHVLALSGLHVGIIAFILFALLNFVPNKYAKFILFAIGLSAYIALTGFQPSAVRAGAMALLVVLAKTLQKEYHPLNIISIVVLLSIIFEPSLVFSAGFQMSVASIFGIVVFYNPILALLNMIFSSENKAVSYLKSSVSITLAASAVVSPLVAYYFGVYSIISLLTNILVIPLISFSLVVAILSLALSLISPVLASIAGDSVTFALLLSEKINIFASSLDGAYISGRYALAISLITLPAIAYISFSKSRNQAAFRLAAVLIAFPILIAILPEEKKEELSIYPLKQMTVSILNEAENGTLVYLADRKPSQIPRTEYRLIEYLESIPDSLTLLVNGNAGINTADILKEKRAFRYIELNPSFQKSLEMRIFGDKKLSQIIEMK